ncbi:LOB domain-containing protein 4-like [Nicotiana sylvestris]
MPCSACKFLRRRCTQDCIFLPHFPTAEPQKFIAVHRIFGASNISKILQVSSSKVLTSFFLINGYLLPDNSAKQRLAKNEKKSPSIFVCLDLYHNQEIPVDNREDAVISMVYEATARLRDPVYGCVGIISAVQKHVFHLQSELNEALAEAMFLRTQLSDALSLPSLIEGSPFTPENHEFLHFQKPSEQNAYANASDALLLLPEAADHYCLQGTEVLPLPYLDI